MKNEIEFIKEQIKKYNLNAHSRKRLMYTRDFIVCIDCINVNISNSDR
jgi:hypothetical protein